MTTWSLPPHHPDDDSHPEWLFDQWTTAKAWNWLRAGHLDPQDHILMSRLVIHALKDLGISEEHLSAVWAQRYIKDCRSLKDPWVIPLIKLPATPTEMWPPESSEIADTPVGLLAVLIANGWNGFTPFLPYKVKKQRAPPDKIIHPSWGVEIVMGNISQTYITDQWRLCLIDQMMRTPFCPSITSLSTRLICKTRKAAGPLSWWKSALKYKNPVAMRVCLDYGVQGEIGDDWPENMSNEEKLWLERCLINNKTIKASSNLSSSRPRL